MGYDYNKNIVHRDKDEPLKVLTPEEKRELTKKEQPYGTMFSPRRERALKIYLDSPKKRDDWSSEIYRVFIYTLFALKKQLITRGNNLHSDKTKYDYIYIYINYYYKVETACK